jgi:hypothetical protein
MLSNDIMDYHIVSQGKTTIPSVDDGEEMGLTDVRTPQKRLNAHSSPRHTKISKKILLYVIVMCPQR